MVTTKELKHDIKFESNNYSRLEEIIKLYLKSI